MAALLEREDSNLRPSELRAALQRSRTIDTSLEQEREKRKREIQLLVLGPPCSGKSTFIKQLKILYGGGYSEDERKEFKTMVNSLVKKSISELLTDLKKIEDAGTSTETKDLISRACRCVETSTSDRINEEEAVVYKALWEDEVIKDHMTHIQEDSTVIYTLNHFMNSLDRISQEPYIPSVQDILLLRLETQGIQESLFSLSNVNYRVIDVAGQHTQRKKWIHLFEGVTAVVFFASLTSIWKNTKSDNSEQNNFLKAIQLFEEVTHSQFLREAEFILFLNKHDLFLENLKSATVNCCFPEYKDESNPDNVLEFIKEKFLGTAPEGRSIYIHVTCATHTDIMRELLGDVFDIIIDRNIKKIVPF